MDGARIKFWLENAHFYCHDEKNLYCDKSEKSLLAKLESHLSWHTEVREYVICDLPIDDKSIKLFQKYGQLFSQYEEQLTELRDCNFTLTKEDFVEFLGLFPGIFIFGCNFAGSIVCDNTLKTFLEKESFDFRLEHSEVTRLPEVTDETLITIKKNLGFYQFVIGDTYVTNISIGGLEQFIKDLLPVSVADTLRKERPIITKISLGTILVDYAQTEEVFKRLMKEYNLRTMPNILNTKYCFKLNGNNITIEFFSQEHLINQDEFKKEMNKPIEAN